MEEFNEQFSNLLHNKTMRRFFVTKLYIILIPKIIEFVCLLVNTDTTHTNVKLIFHFRKTLRQKKNLKEDITASISIRQPEYVRQKPKLHEH